MGAKIEQPEAGVFLDHNAGMSVAAYWKLVAEREYGEEEAFHWPTAEMEFEVPDGAEVLVCSVRHGNTDAVLYFADAVLHIHLVNGNVAGAIAGSSRGVTKAILEVVEELWPRSVAAEDEVPVTFWSYTPNGPRSISRRINVPAWEAVVDNYGGETRSALHRMMTDFRPSHGGQLILWQGIPGTGKTWALRALASEWRDWADLHYITDPEIFFGEKADYMLDVLLDDDQPTVEYVPDGEDDLAARGRWRVLLLEDTGEILAADAKEKTGQALSRLLNVVDGLIGQGLRILVLVTTNEELKKLHPAVSRPGRCAARIEFGELSGDEAKAWLEPHDVGYLGGASTIAELYALVDERETYEEVPVGFVQ